MVDLPLAVCTVPAGRAKGRFGGHGQPVWRQPPAESKGEAGRSLAVVALGALSKWPPREIGGLGHEAKAVPHGHWHESDQVRRPGPDAEVMGQHLLR